MRTTAMAVAALAACAAYADYTVTTNDGAVAFFNDTGVRKTIADSYLVADGIVSLDFYSPNGYFNFFPSAPCTYSGGTTISRGQVFVNRSDALGTGPITIKDSSSLMVDGYNLAFDNKIVFNTDHSYVVGYNGGSVTLRSVGTEGAAHRIRIGRTGAGAASRATLSLTGADSEAVGRIYTSGNLDLTLDGGTIAARSDAESPFFASATANDTPRATIAPSGVTFDVAEGADMELGLSPTFRRDTVTNVVETVAIPNGDFESGLTGWTIDYSANSQYSGAQSNGAAFDTSGDVRWTTTNTTHYLMLRVNQKVSRTITVPSDGLWRVVFDQGCRPGGDNFYSLGMDTVVKVGDVGTTTFGGPKARDDRYGFKRFETDVMSLSAEESYNLEVALVQADAVDPNKSMNFDVFRLERVELEEVHGCLTKTGGGLLRTGEWRDGDVAVAAGSLNVESAAVSNMTISVVGGTLELTDAMVEDGTLIDVASGGTLAFAPVGRADLIGNGSFEEDGERTDIVAMNPNRWTVGKAKETELNVNGSGLQGNGGNVSAEGPLTPAGTVTAYLREDSTLSQTVTVAAAGKHRLSFLKACRTTLYSNTMPLAVYVDGGEPVFSCSSNSTNAFERFAVDIDLSAGDHAIVFATGEPAIRTSAGAMVFIDDVRLNPLKGQPEVALGTVNMASGSTLRLDNLDRVVIRDFRVDGTPIRGGRADVTAAGIAVTGGGSVRFGEIRGTILIIR